MGSMLLSIELIILIIVLFNEKIKIEYKILICFCGYLLIALLSLIFNINVLIYLISSLSVGLGLKFKNNFEHYKTKTFLVIVCGLTFFSINVWAFVAVGVLWLYFDYGFFNGLIRGFKDMNSSFDFMVGLTNELLLQTSSGGIPEGLRLITEKISDDISKWDILKSIIELLDYL